MFYLDLFRDFQKNEIKYLVVGGLAVNLHGVPRMTNDVDVILSEEKENLVKFIESMRRLGYVPKLPVKADVLLDDEKINIWIKDRNLKAFTFYNTKDNYKVVDFLIVHPLNFAESYERKTVKSIDELEIHVVSYEDLITMKKSIGRPRDNQDINLLERVRKLMGDMK
ncbi:MAG TPA: hypothetical protein PL048_12465 [Leptospiraceae bacterium]|nr:hypothetical protein [Leptospiraceae bacterium]HNF26134.1 hypothetical protein [Leptospiraceae bacterium]HNI99862.1 hypothetical protein [Leptospiraceae bacterium]HNM02316.1 hypothetical protein [Leptospiraceae bacterium]HNN03983.1 hypothetical protein [Leptospiraceae bacterium]